MTNFQVIYDAFLGKILDDEWTGWTAQEIEEDLKSLLIAAIPNFKFPKVSLDYGATSFNEDLKNEEIQILATYMKCEWLNRAILTWENIKPLYEERDFSQANLLSKFNDTLAAEKENARRLESLYYRSTNYKPFDYKKLATNIKHG